MTETLIGPMPEDGLGRMVLLECGRKLQLFPGSPVLRPAMVVHAATVDGVTLPLMSPIQTTVEPCDYVDLGHGRNRSERFDVTLKHEHFTVSIRVAGWVHLITDPNDLEARALAILEAANQCHNIAMGVWMTLLAERIAQEASR